MIFPLRLVRNSITKYLTSSGFIRKNWENCGGCLTVKDNYRVFSASEHIDIILGIDCHSRALQEGFASRERIP